MRIEQLQLPIIKLIEKGFKQEGDIYKIDILNGYIYFNPTELIYVWYCRMEISNSANSIHLDITTESELDLLLKVFRTKNE